MHLNSPASVFTDVPCGVLEVQRKRGVAAYWHVESVAGKNTVTFNGENRDGELMILQGKMFSVCVWQGNSGKPESGRHCIGSGLRNLRGGHANKQ